MSSAAALAAFGSGASAEPLESSKRPVMRGQAFFKRAVRNPDEIIKAEGLTGNVAFAVADASDGTWLESRNGQMGTPPASVTKAITTLYALDALGAAHQFETSVRVTGGIVDGEVQGDLILVGGGDPTLDTVGLADLTGQLKDAGIIGVKGDFKVYEGALPLVPRIDPEQPDQVGYSPGVSGFALNYNRVHFEWKRADGDYAISMEARAGNYAPAVTMATMAVRDESAPVFIYTDDGDVDRWSVARGALGASGARWLPVRKPGRYAGDVFATLARSEGIVLSDPVMVDDLPQGETVAARKSAPLIEVLEDMLRYSNNLTAEMVGLATTQARQGPVADLRSSAAAMNRWATQELGMDAPKLVDHSGLSDDSTVTAQDMARAMVKVHGGALRPILKPFKMRDQNGRPMEDPPVPVEAKTGTLNFVSGLSGYATARDGRVLAFAIFAANPEERAKISRAERERPPGARAWNGRAKRVQQALLERWGVLYGTEIAGN